MVEEILRVEKVSHINSSVYGFVSNNCVLEETNSCTSYEIDDIAPKGVNITLVDSEEPNLTIYYIKMNRYYLNYVADSYYSAIFEMGGNIFEVNVSFNESGFIEDVIIEKWDNDGSFENGEDGEIYPKEKITYYTLEC